MGKLRPIGSEKLQGKEKLNRILQIAKWNENLPNPINETKSTEYDIVLSDGIQYFIDREKNGYVIKKKIDESVVDYIEPMKNRSYYRSYSQALKRLNLIAKEVNVLTGNENGISLFMEQDANKKYTLSLPKKEVPPSETPDTSTPDMGNEMTPPEEGSDIMPPEEGSDIMPPESDAGMGSIEGDSSDMGDVGGFKSIQKLTGKLAQKLRTIDDEELSSDNIKYIVNSILSAIDMTKLEDEDKESILNRFESDETEGESPVKDEMGSETEDSGMDELPDELDLEEPPSAPEETNEIATMNDVVEKIKSAYAGNLFKNKEVTEGGFYDEVMDGVFSESKVEKVLTKYFKINESEKKEIQRKKIIQENIKRRNFKLSNIEIERLSESKKQESIAKEIIKKYPQSKVIGLTNMKNLVIEHNGTQVKITPKGTIL